MMSLTGIFGFSDAYGSWNTICRSRRTSFMPRASRLVSSLPWNTTEPDVGLCSCRMARPVVDLPQPDSPTTPRVSRASTCSETPVTAWTWPTTRRSRPPP
jgi:hypothetical protein